MRQKTVNFSEENCIYALHYRGKLLSRTGDYSWNYMKKFYVSIGAAKTGKSYLPEHIQKEIEIVKYVPEEK